MVVDLYSYSNLQFSTSCFWRFQTCNSTKLWANVHQCLGQGSLRHRINSPGNSIAFLGSGLNSEPVIEYHNKVTLLSVIEYGNAMETSGIEYMKITIPNITCCLFS